MRTLDKIITGAAIVGIVIGSTPLFLNARYNEDAKSNLAPHAIYIRNALGRIPSSNFEIDGSMVDVNGNGDYESVLAYKNPATGEIEMRLIELYGNEIKIRKYEVVDGEIRYLSE